MPAQSRTDVLIVSVGGTFGWRAAADDICEALAGLGVRVARADAGPVREIRTFMATDLMQASAARKAALLAIAEHRPEAVVYCSVTAALLWPRAGAIWLDAVAAENRPGRHGIWQRAVEGRRLARAPLLMTWDPAALAPFADRRHADAITLAPVIAPSDGTRGAAEHETPALRDLAALAYAADPRKRRLDALLDAWRRARREDETLVVAGLRRPDEPGVRFTGPLAPEAFRALLRRARVFVSAARREDFGIAALEALADGAMLVCTPAPGTFPALALARELDPRLVAESVEGLPAALRRALDDPRADYGPRAATLTARYGPRAMADTLNAEVLPRLLPGWRS